MQVATVLVYALEKKFRVAIATVNPARFTLSLPVEIKCAEKKLSVTQSTNTFYIRATDFCFVLCQKEHFSHSL